MSVAARPALRRDPSHGIAAGVCVGLARQFAIDPWAVRVAFVIGTAAGGFGIVFYVIAWAAIPAEPGTTTPGARRARAKVAAGGGLLMGALLLSLRELGFWFSDALAWPVVLAAVGGGLLWRQSRPTSLPAEPTPRAEVAAGVYRGGFGVALVVGAGLLFLQSNGALGPARDVILAVVVVLVALALVLAPLLWRLGRNLNEERTERIRSQERAELAAHLHDSVLQTLALVQKRADDPRAVATLARRQERELRAWLWEPGSPAPETSLAASLRAAAAEVEDAHDVPVEVVTVGDAPVDDSTRALTAAVREALTNAAKFAGDAGPVALYAESSDGHVQVFVRDRGAGFDPAAIPPDRRGVRDSIVARMERHGGRAVIHEAPGGGTEVELTLERPPT